MNAKYAGTSSEMVSLMANGGGGQYDLVSASGDADLRLIYGGDVQPVNVNLIPSWKDFHPFLKSPSFNTIDGVHYGVSLQFGPNVLLYSTTAFPTAPTSWSTIYSSQYKGKISVPNNPIQIADAALYLSKTNTSLGITDPYELTQPQFDAAVNLLKQQKPLIKKYWNLASDEISLFQNHEVVVGAAWPFQTGTLKAAGFPAADDDPDARARPVGPTRWLLATKAPHPNCAYLWMKYISTPKPQAAAGVVVRRDAGQLARRAAIMDQLAEGRLRRPARRQARLVLREPQVLEDAARAVRQRQERLRAVPEVGHRLDPDHRLAADRRAECRTERRRACARVSAALWRRPWLRAVAHDLAAARVVPRDLSRVARGDAHHRVLERRPVHEQPAPPADARRTSASSSRRRTCASSGARSCWPRW